MQGSLILPLSLDGASLDGVLRYISGPESATLAQAFEV